MSLCNVCKAKPAADDIRYSGMCVDCYQADCEAGIAQANEMNTNMRLYGTIDVPAAATIGKHAIQIIMQFQVGGAWPTDMSHAPSVLAKVGTMLVLYGSKDEALLNNMHERGFTDVTLEDVQQVRQFLLEQ